MPPYRRIILKLSGEALAGEKGYGIDVDVIEDLGNQISYLRNSGVQIGIVIGGGNVLRGAQGEELGIDRATADYMGMLATVINALALQNVLMKKDLDARVMSSLSLVQIAEPYDFCWRNRLAVLHHRYDRSPTGNRAEGRSNI